MPSTSHGSVVLSIVVPVFNEEQILPELYDRLKKAAQAVTDAHEIIFVNDGSRDNTLVGLVALAAKDECVRYIGFSRNFGHQIAVTAGLDHAKGAAVVIIDGDLQDPPELIPEMYARHKEGFEVVYARRNKREGESYFKKMTAKLFYRIIKRLTSFEIPVDVGDYRLIDRKIVDLLKQMPEQNKFLRGQIAWLGFRQTFVLFNRDKRKYGKTGYPFSKMLKFALDGITSFSDAPLQFVTRAGAVVSGLSLLIIAYAVYSHFFLQRTITGWTSLIISSTFIGGIQLLTVGVIGEYISRINKNVINRPLYVIDQTNLEEQEK